MAIEFLIKIWYSNKHYYSTVKTLYSLLLFIEYYLLIIFNISMAYDECDYKYHDSSIIPTYSGAVVTCTLMIQDSIVRSLLLKILGLISRHIIHKFIEICTRTTLGASSIMYCIDFNHKTILIFSAIEMTERLFIYKTKL